MAKIRIYSEILDFGASPINAMFPVGTTLSRVTFKIVYLNFNLRLLSHIYYNRLAISII
jgi:hypothetical protein